MDPERTPNRYFRKAVAAGVLTFMGVCGGMVVTGAIAENADHNQLSNNDNGNKSIEQPTNHERGTDITLPFAVAVAGLGVAFACCMVDRQGRPVESSRSPLDGSHDTLPSDPDIDLQFTRLTADLAAQFSPDTGRFNA